MVCWSWIIKVCFKNLAMTVTPQDGSLSAPVSMVQTVIRIHHQTISTSSETRTSIKI